MDENSQGQLRERVNKQRFQRCSQGAQILKKSAGEMGLEQECPEKQESLTSQTLGSSVQGGSAYGAKHYREGKGIKTVPQKVIMWKLLLAWLWEISV